MLTFKNILISYREVHEGLGQVHRGALLHQRLVDPTLRLHKTRRGSRREASTGTMAKMA